MPSGEWWIDDDGQATFADGDTGDQNHEMIAFWSFIQLDDEEAPESVSPSGIDLTALGEDMLSELGVRESIVDIGKWDDEKWNEFCSDNDLDPFSKNEGGFSWSKEEVLGLNKLVAMGANMDFVWWWHQSKQQDSREYAIEVKNWIRVQGDHFEMSVFDQDALDRIRGADLWDQEEDPETLEVSDDLVYFSERSTGKFFSVPLKVLFDTGRSYVDIMNYGERGQEGGEEHLALNPIRVKPERFYDQKELKLGIEVEKEHSDSYQRRSITARQHLEEDRRYYTKLKKAGLNPPKSLVVHNDDLEIDFNVDVAVQRGTLQEVPIYSLYVDGKLIGRIARRESGMTSMVAWYDEDSPIHHTRLLGFTFDEAVRRMVELWLDSPASENPPDTMGCDGGHCHGCGFITQQVVRKSGSTCSRCGFVNTKPHRVTEYRTPAGGKFLVCTDCGAQESPSGRMMEIGDNPPLPVEQAGLSDNPQQFLDKMSFNTKGIIVDGRLVAWETDERGNPHHLDVGKKLGIDTSKTTQITLERYVTGNDYVITSLGIILKGGLYSKDEAMEEARGLVENYVSDLDGLSDAEVIWSDRAGSHRWQGRSRELGVMAANPPAVYRVHFFDIWHGRRDFRETTAETEARARSNVRAQLADERGLHPSQLPAHQYLFRQVERIG